MSTKTLPTQESIDNDPRLDGPIPEFDKYGDHTGHHFWRCTGCDVEAMRQRDVRAECDCGGL